VITEISFSTERPPNTTPTFVFIVYIFVFVLVLFLRLKGIT